MKIVRQPAEVPRAAGPVALAIGFLDGVHLGHQQVIRAAMARAHSIGGEAWVMTFEPHPLQILRPGKAPPLLTPTPQKLRLLEALGVDGCLLIPFTPALAQREPEDFIADLAGALPPLAGVAVGANWTFGHRGRGDTELLRALGERHDFVVEIVAPVLVGGAPVSSTRVRQAVQTGDLRGAAALLGRPFSVCGRVEPGRGVGRGLGFPTANLDALHELHPPKGVYAVQAQFDGVRRGGAAYFGHRPTFDATPQPVLEVHLFDTDADLYGKELEVFFLAHLRGDQLFASPEALRLQIERDVARARAIVAAKERP